MRLYHGIADVTLVGKNTGAVSGSLLINSTNTGFTFIRTNVATGGGAAGLLASDTYTKSEVAAELGVSRHTLWRELNR